MFFAVHRAIIFCSSLVVLLKALEQYVAKIKSTDKTVFM